MGAGSIATAAAADPLAEYSLGDKTAEGVTDHDRLGCEPADDLGVMVDDIGDAFAGDGLDAGAGGLHGVRRPGPAWR